jgi:hypothetical protein
VKKVIGWGKVLAETHLDYAGKTTIEKINLLTDKYF